MTIDEIRQVAEDVSFFMGHGFKQVRSAVALVELMDLYEREIEELREAKVEIESLKDELRQMEIDLDNSQMNERNAESRVEELEWELENE